MILLADSAWYSSNPAVPLACCQEGDRITAYEVVEKRLKLEEAHAATVALDELLGNGHEEPQGYRRGRR